jgi:site-specific DNA-methyltransferase (adenine-specific)
MPPGEIFSTKLGVLYEGDCLEILPQVHKETVATVFADPPYNLGKNYGEKVNDDLPETEYLKWCNSWISECVRALMPGGAFFLYNLPKWNIILANYLLELGMDFRHWIAVNMKVGLPIPGRLYPSHYSLLYFTKGKPRVFKRIRTPIEKCRHCGKDIKDYGGHRNAMNPNGVNLPDVWNDIPPVRHRKFKSSRRAANQISTKLLQRVVNLSTEEGNLVLDPFGGSGTTYYVCEMENRRWIGIELESCDIIMERLKKSEIVPHETNDFVEG